MKAAGVFAHARPHGAPAQPTRDERAALETHLSNIRDAAVALRAIEETRVQWLTSSSSTDT
jgi:hypothetical protein